MHCVFAVTSVGSVRQPFRHPAVVNPLTGWLTPPSGLLAGVQERREEGIYCFMSWHLETHQRILFAKAKEGQMSSTHLILAS